jgi:hypothetical protein
MAQKYHLLIRYYLLGREWSAAASSSAAQELIARKLALPLYAGLRQKILEALTRWIARDLVLKGRRHNTGE